eukprot:6483022-Karenia_brevis.AAC.1
MQMIATTGTTWRHCSCSENGANEEFFWAPFQQPRHQAGGSGGTSYTVRPCALNDPRASLM